MTRTVTAFGREWSHCQFYGLVRAVIDHTGLVVESGGWKDDYWCCIAEPCQGGDAVSRSYGAATPWLALCEAVEKMEARDA